MASASAGGQEVLFPTPLHLTREIHDPLSQTTSIIDEYCVGNRIVSVRGTLTAIADYDKGELLEIDRAAGTYSITPFREIAKARSEIVESRARSQRPAWISRVVAPRTIAGRLGDTMQSELATSEARERVEVTADRDIVLRKAALEALLGTAYPNEADARTEAVLDALRPRGGRMEASSASADSRYRLPLEERISIDIEGQTIEMRKTVTRIGSETPPPNLTVIPPGAKLVESDLVVRSRLLRQLDRLPTAAPNP